MYGEILGAKNPDMEQRKVPELSTQIDRFEKALSNQSDLLNTLENKMHDILNRRGPEKNPVPEAREMNDFVASLSYRINTLEGNNIRLEKILNHFRELL